MNKAELIKETAEYLIPELIRRGLMITTVESCTGGMAAAALTSVAGSSSVFHQGYVTYCDDAKHHLVGVRRKTLKKYTAVSSQTAVEMAMGGCRKAHADICISVTGYAGPATGDDADLVGLVYIGCTFCGKTSVREFHFCGDRSEVRASACAQALLMVKRSLEKYPEGTPQKKK